MLSEQDVYEQIKQMQEIELRQRMHFADLIDRLDNTKLRNYFQRFMDMEEEHRQMLEDLASLYAKSM